MGVPRLLSTLTPHGERKPLDGARVIIDGPALAYCAVGLCMADPVMSAARNHPLDQPTYDQLGDAALGWLDELRSRGITIEALYFDGYLPKAKRPVRLERSYRTSAQLKDVCAFYQRDNLPGFDVKGPRTGSLLPAPPFAVPAVLDALRASAVYGPATIVVPGEADTFCAEHARTRGGGTVITSDSDLLVQDLGPDAEVVLFRDVVDIRTATADKPLVVPTYTLSTISRRLSLPGDREGVMVDFAFELSLDPHLSVSELADQTNKGYAKTKYAQEYAEFAEQYAYPSRLVDGAKRYDITKLDPRVSELVLQSLFPGEGGAHDPKTSADEIFAFEPPLLDNCIRTNAWEPSAAIRACAFSLLQVLAGRRIKKVREYARMASMATRGSELDLAPVAKLGPMVDSLAALIRQVRESTSTPLLQWAALASYHDIQWAKANSKTSVCLEVMYEETSASGTLHRVTWDGVHWLAEIQATLYSLRVLKQITLFVLEATGGEAGGAEDHRLDAALAASLAGLKEVLLLPAVVPPLKDYPTLRILQDLPAQLKGAGALKLLAELADIPEGIKFKAEVKKNKNKNKSKSKKRKRSDQAAGPAAGGKAAANPFSILGVE